MRARASVRAFLLHGLFDPLVDVGGYGVFQRALRFEDVLDGVASRAFPAPACGHEVRVIFDDLAGVRDSDGESDLAHDGNIDDVIADITDLIFGYARLGANLAKSDQLVRLSLVAKVEAQVARAKAYGLADPFGDQSDFETAELGERDAAAVVCVESLSLDHGRTNNPVTTLVSFSGAVLGGFRGAVRTGGCRLQPDGSIGQNAVDVEQQHFDLLSTLQ